MNRVVSCGITLAVALCAAAAEEPLRPIKIGPDTTVLTGPLRPDGTVDYVAALNAQLSVGVTPANNAAVKLLEAFGPEFIDEDVRMATLKAMGAALPEGGRHFVSFSDFDPGDTREFDSDSYDKLDKLRSAPWHAKDHPRVVRWLSANVVPLANIIEASKRPRMYIPLVLAKKEERLSDILGYRLPFRPKLSQATTALIVRAQLAISEGRTNDACTDIATAYRLGVLQAQCPLLIDRIVGVSLIGRTSDGVISLATSGRLSPAQARKMVREVAALNPRSTMADVMDKSDRYFSLAFWQKLSRDDTAMENYKKVMEWVEKEEDKAFFGFVISVLKSGPHQRGVDWNAVLRLENKDIDRVVTMMRIKNFAQRRKMIEAMDAEEKKDAADMKQAWRELGKPAMAEDTKSLKVDAKWVHHAMVALNMFPGMIGRVVELEDIAYLRRDMAVVGVALAGYRAEKGRYPTRLDELKPAWLGNIPMDICSGKPLIYKPSAEGYLLYSVGRNMRDNGGRDEPESWMKKDTDSLDDIIIRTPPKS